MRHDGRLVLTQCPEINVGRLSPGQSGQTQAISSAKVCGFHDHGSPNDGLLQGTITVR